MNEMNITPQPRKNLFRRTATTVFSVFNRAHGAEKKSKSTAITVCADDDELSKDSKDTIATSVDDLSCAFTDAANEDPHTVDAELATHVSEEVDDKSKDSNAADSTTTAVATAVITATDGDFKDEGSVTSSEGTATTEMEFYHGDGHSPRNYGEVHYPGYFEQHVDKMDGSCSREEWAASRDDFDFIVAFPDSFVDTPKPQVGSKDLKHVMDIDNSLIVCLDKGNTLGCKHQATMVAIESPRSIFDDEGFNAIEAAMEGRYIIYQTNKEGEIEDHGREAPTSPYVTPIPEKNSLKASLTREN